MKYKVISLTLLTALLGGCATTDEYGIPKEHSPLAQFVARTVVENTLDLLIDDNRPPCGYECERTKNIYRSAHEFKKQLKDEKRAEAVQQSFDQRHSATDIADTIEHFRSNNDWITEGEKQQRPIIQIDNPNELD